MPVRVRVQTFPQYPTIVSDVFSLSPEPDPTVKRGELRAQLPPGREKWLLSDDLKKKIRDSKAALLEKYHEFGVPQFLACVNDPTVTLVRGRTSGGHETKVMGPGKPKPVDVYYVSDLTPSNEDGCGRSLSDPACTAQAVPFPPSERLESPRTLNLYSRLGGAATYEGIDINLLHMGTTGSDFSWHAEDHLQQSVSYLHSMASKMWFFIAKSEVPRMVRVLIEHMDPVVLAAARGDVWQVLGLQASLWPSSFFLAHCVRVGFHKMVPGDCVVTGYGVFHSGFNAKVDVASDVTLACTGWLVHAIEHAMHWRGKLRMLIPVEKLLVLSALKLADGKWWFVDAIAYEALEPTEFQRDLDDMVSYLSQYLDSVLSYINTEAKPAWSGKKLSELDFDQAPQLVRRFIVENDIKPSGEPFALPEEKEGAETELSRDGAACPHCGIVTWLSVVVCTACIEQLGAGAGPRAPICCWRCAPSKYDESHYRAALHDGEPGLLGCHAPLVVQRLPNGRTYLLIYKLKMMGGNGSGGRA